MQIYVTTETGEGPTPLAAFDAALINAGVPNFLSKRRLEEINGGKYGILVEYRLPI